MSVPRAVFFDAGNTLVRMNYGAIARALVARGISVTAGRVQEAEWRARVRLDEGVLARLPPGGSPESESTSGRYLAYLLEELGVTDAVTLEAVAVWRRAYNPPVGVWEVADPEAEVALERLRAAGLRAAVISNSNGSIAGILERLGLARHLEFVIDSTEVGVEKPSPAIFRLALARAGLEPGEAVYVGDLYSIDVRGARAAGLGTVLLDPGGYWGERDCPIAPGLLAAVELILAR